MNPAGLAALMRPIGISINRKHRRRILLGFSSTALETTCPASGLKAPFSICSLLLRVGTVGSSALFLLVLEVQVRAVHVRALLLALLPFVAAHVGEVPELGIATLDHLLPLPHSDLLGRSLFLRLLADMSLVAALALEEGLGCRLRPELRHDAWDVDHHLLVDNVLLIKAQRAVQASEVDGHEDVLIRMLVWRGQRVQDLGCDLHPVLQLLLEVLQDLLRDEHNVLVALLILVGCWLRGGTRRWRHQVPEPLRAFSGPPTLCVGCL